MGGATGSRERAPDDRLRDTHQVPARKRDGFRSALPILQTPCGYESRVALRSGYCETTNRQLLRRQADHLASAIHFLEAVDVVLGTLPADRHFQSHKTCDAADKRRAFGCFRVPDR